MYSPITADGLPPSGERGQAETDEGQHDAGDAGRGDAQFPEAIGRKRFVGWIRSASTSSRSFQK